MSDKEIHKRLKKIRENLNYNQKEFAIELNINQQGLSDIERKKKSISLEIIELLINKFNLNSNWLITGDGEMFKEEKEQTGDYSGNNILNGSGKQIISVKHTNITECEKEVEYLKNKISDLEKRIQDKEEIINLLKKS